MLPNFFFVGARKCGSTSFHRGLCAHPDVVMASKKETKFFVSEKEFGRGAAFYEARYFGDWHGERAIGEADPEIIDAEDAPDRIRSLLGSHVRLIFCFRHPVERAYSHYLHNVARFNEFDRFEHALRQDAERRVPWRQYRRTSNYAHDLKRFLEVFPRERCLFLVFEDLYGPGRDASFRQVFEFLEVDPLPIQVPHEKQRFLPQVRLVIASKDCATHEALEPGDIVIDNPNLGRQVVRRPSRACREQFERYVEMAAPLTLPPSERGRLFSEYFEAFLPPFEEILDRHITQWRDP